MKKFRSRLTLAALTVALSGCAQDAYYKALMAREATKREELAERRVAAERADQQMALMAASSNANVQAGAQKYFETRALLSTIGAIIADARAGNDAIAAPRDAIDYINAGVGVLSVFRGDRQDKRAAASRDLSARLNAEADALTTTSITEMYTRGVDAAGKVVFGTPAP